MYYSSGTNVRCCIGRRFVFIHQVAALFCMKMTSFPPRCFESVTSSQKSYSANRCVFTWRAFLPNFVPIRFETTEGALGIFWRRSPQQEKEEIKKKEEENKKKKKKKKKKMMMMMMMMMMSSDIRSVPDLKRHFMYAEQLAIQSINQCFYFRQRGPYETEAHIHTQANKK